MKAYWHYLSGKVFFFNTAAKSNTKDMSVLVRKKCVTLNFTWLNEALYMPIFSNPGEKVLIRKTLKGGLFIYFVVVVVIVCCP